MKIKGKILKAALASAFVLASTSSLADGMGDSKGKEKCHGVAKKGKNDCGTATHGCGGKAATDYDPKEWKFVKKGMCKKIQEKIKSKAAKKETK